MKYKRIFPQSLILKLILIIAPLVCCQMFSLAQGGWNIQYFPITILPSDIIGKEVRIDFKSNSSSNTTTLQDSSDIRAYFSSEDTVSFSVNDKEILFKESWKIYPDQGFLNEQSLKIIDSETFPNGNIKEMYITKFDDVNIFLEIKLYYSNQVMTSTIVLEKSKVLGILTKI